MLRESFLHSKHIYLKIVCAIWAHIGLCHTWHQFIPSLRTPALAYDQSYLAQSTGKEIIGAINRTKRESTRKSFAGIRISRCLANPTYGEYSLSWSTNSTGQQILTQVMQLKWHFPIPSNFYAPNTNMTVKMQNRSSFLCNLQYIV